MIQKTIVCADKVLNGVKARVLEKLKADALLVSFPKSGRTWLRFMIANYLNQFAKLGLDLDLNNMFSLVPNDGRGFSSLARFRYGERRALPLVVATHRTSAAKEESQSSVIFLKRDPVDIFLSAAYNNVGSRKMITPIEKDQAAFVEILKTHPVKGIGAYCTFMNSWAHELEYQRHVVVSYEKLLGAPAEQLGMVLSLIGLPIEKALIVESVRLSTFGRMRVLEKSRGVGFKQISNTNSNRRYRVNIGKAGRGKLELANETLQFVEDYLAIALTDKAKVLLAK